MKTFLKKFLPVGLLLFALAGSASAQGRIATIDLRKLFDKYWKREQAEAQLKGRGTDMDKELKGLMDDWKKSRDEYQKLLSAANDQAVSPEERERRKKAAEKKLLEIKESEQTIEGYRKQATATLDEQKRRMRDKILEEIRGVVNTKAKAGGYSMVIDTAAETVNGTPVVIYSNNENDLTESVLTELNSTRSPVDTPKATEKK